MTINSFDRQEDYDFNIYCPDDNSVSLTAYQQYYTLDSDGDPILNIDTKNYYTKSFDRQLNKEEWRFLTKTDPEDTTESISEYDDWIGLLDLVKPETPVAILEFLQSLPEYEPQEPMDYETEGDYSALFETSN